MRDTTREVERSGWLPAVQQGWDDGYRFFDVLTAVDREAEGLEVLLRAWDVDGRRGLLLSTRCPLGDEVVPSVVSVYAGAAWHERATAELFGLRFEGHDTVPLLLSERFEGHPLRKEFVLAARVARPWPGVKEPGESEADLAVPRRRISPPGRPADWGPR